MVSKHQSPSSGWWKTPSGLGLLGFLAIAAFFLITEHWAHVLGAFPYVLLLLCPLMHLLMHRGHGGGHARHGEERQRSQGEHP